MFDNVDMRVFLAIEIPNRIKRDLVGIQRELVSQIPNVRWEKPEKLHITLIFLGGVDEERVGELEEVVRKGLKGGEGVKPFEIGLSGVGVFPNERRPRVVLVDVADGAEQVAELQRRLAEALAGAGFEFARLKRPHVTLGRFKRRRDSTLRVVKLSEARGWPLLTLRVNKVTIMGSELRPTGAIHTPIARIPLC